MSERLSQQEYFRYARHLVLPEFGVEGQLALKNSSVLIIGVGGLGSPISMYLAAVGVGHIGLVDYDTVEESNLQRQIVHGATRLGERKVESARRRLLDLNPLLEIDVYDTIFNSHNAMEIAAEYQVLVDGTDNLPTRYLLNDLAVITKKPFVYGSVFRFEGQVSVFDAQKGPCYRCLFPTPPNPDMVPSCQAGGVLGVLPGIIGTIEALQTIKLLAGIGEMLIGKLLIIDALDLEFRTIRFAKSKLCPICGNKPTINSLIDYEQFCGSTIGSTTQINEGIVEFQLSPEDLHKLIVDRQAIHLLDVRYPAECRISSIPGSQNSLPEQVLDIAKYWEKDEKIIVYCRTGIRSARVVKQLIQKGYSNVWNLKGGINAWAREIDPKMMQY